MTGLILTRGLPASGKTTFARRWVGEQSRRARVNRDDLRAQLFDGEGILDRVREELVTEVQRSMVQSLLKSGVSVIVDDTNLRLKYARAWADLAVEVGVDFDVVDMTTSAETCIRWDARR